MRRICCLLLGLAAPPLTWSHAVADGILISGRVSAPPDLLSTLRPEDRLILKLYHPDDGIEKDLRYWIIDDFELPRSFDIAPSVDMTGHARWPTYVVEAFTDRDGDVLNAVPGELHAMTDGPVPLGTLGLELELSVPGG